MENKKQLGQFFTADAKRVLKGLEIYVRGKKVTDPFAGAGDLMSWAGRNGAKSVVGFDIDKKLTDGQKVFFNDSILGPKKYEFVVTNPPYLYISKADKKTKEKYFRNAGYADLYQLGLESIMDSEEGIVVVPLNFLCAKNAKKIRQRFFAKFRIVEMNYFKDRAFSDTTNNVVGFYYTARNLPDGGECTIKTNIYPDGKTVEIRLERKYGWIIGGEAIDRIKNRKNVLGIRRLQDKHLEKGPKIIELACGHIKRRKYYHLSENSIKLLKKNIILLKAIDSGSATGRIAVEDIRKYKVGGLVSKLTSRHMVQIIFKKKVTIGQQKKLIGLFNRQLNALRQDHDSFFLTNYRDKDRKRISYAFAYKFLNYLYEGLPDRLANSLDKQRKI